MLTKYKLYVEVLSYKNISFAYKMLLLSYYDLTRLKRFVSSCISKLCNQFFYLPTFNTLYMRHLLYLMFGCDGKFGIGGSFLGTKHSQWCPLHLQNVGVCSARDTCDDTSVQCAVDYLNERLQQLAGPASRTCPFPARHARPTNLEPARNMHVLWGSPSQLFVQSPPGFNFSAVNR